MRLLRRALLSLMAAGVLLHTPHARLQAQRPPNPPDELATTVRDGFTMASVGDLVIAYPTGGNPDPAFTSITKLIRDADVATANYEANIIDGRSFKGSAPGGFGGTPDVADADSGGKTAGILRLELPQSPETSQRTAQNGVVKVPGILNRSQNQPLTLVPSEASLTRRHDALGAGESPQPTEFWPRMKHRWNTDPTKSDERSPSPSMFHPCFIRG